MVNYIRTPAGIHMVIGGKPVTVASTDRHFQEIVDAIKKGATESDVQAILQRELSRISSAIKLTPDVEVKGGVLYYKGAPLNNAVVDRIMRMLDEGFNVDPLLAFLDNLLQNPSYRVVQHLYAFLEHGGCPITEDGCFLAYKAVRADFKDIHSGTFDNSLGSVVEMPRNQVDEDPNNTCSHGLHVCSFGYLPHFAHADGHVMVCKVNPRDVVAIPTDYNQTKMRVCRYEVVDEYKDYYRKAGNVLANTTVATKDDKPFRLQVDNGDGCYEERSAHSRLSEAAQALEQLDGDTGWRRARIVNAVTDVEIQVVDNDDYADPDYEDEDPDAYDEDADQSADEQPAARATYALRVERGSAPARTEELGIPTAEDAIRRAAGYLTEAGVQRVVVVDERNDTPVKTFQAIG